MHFNFDNVNDRKFYDIVFYPCKLLARILYKFNCTGVENIPKEGPFILISNHIHFVDPALLICCCPRKIHFMGKTEAFEKSAIAAAVLSGFNTFPVSRGRSDKRSIEYAVKLIETGHVMGIFPEGTRSKDLKPHEFKSGVSLIARETKADILPCSVYCDKPKGFRRKISIRFGEIIPYAELGITEEHNTNQLRAASKMMMDKVTELWEEGYC